MNDDPRSDDPRIDETARRVQDAVSAHGRTVQPDEDGSLPVIRHRVASARRRRLVGATALGAAAALVIGVAIGVAAGGDDTTTVAVGDVGSTTTTDPCPPPTTSSDATTTTVTTAPSTASIPTTSTTTTTSAPDSADAGGPSTIAPANAPLTAVPTTIPPRGTSDEVIGRVVEEDCAGPTTGTVPTTGTTTTTPSTTTTTGQDLPLRVIFPVGLYPDGGDAAWQSPESTATAFLEAIGVTDPALGAYEETAPGEGRITLHTRDGAGVVRADVVRSVLRLVDIGAHWAVVDARSPSVVVDRAEVQPPADGQGHWTLALAGRARGFEGTIHVTVTGHGDVAWSAEEIVTASGGEELLPFSTFVDLGRPPVGGATVIVANESGEDGSPSDITAFPIDIAVP